MKKSFEYMFYFVEMGNSFPNGKFILDILLSLLEVDKFLECSSK